MHEYLRLQFLVVNHLTGLYDINEIRFELILIRTRLVWTASDLGKIGAVPYLHGSNIDVY